MMATLIDNSHRSINEEDIAYIHHVVGSGRKYCIVSFQGEDHRWYNRICQEELSTEPTGIERRIIIMKKLISTFLLISILLCSLLSAIAENDKYDLSDFGWKRVDSKGRGSLVFQKAPAGKSMSGHKFYTGDQIYVNLYYRENGYAFAYENGEYGYVDASYIDWGNSSSTYSSKYPDQRTSGWQLDYLGEYYVVNCDEWVSLREHADTSSSRLAKVPLGARVVSVYDTIFDFYLCEYNGEVGFILKKYLSPNPGRETINPSKDDRYNLDMYEYRRVSSKGRGSLVFQRSPGGSFISGFKYHDGDWIYVNVEWRSKGYAMAYENGTYGYVDASYIAW